MFAVAPDGCDQVPFTAFTPAVDSIRYADVADSEYAEFRTSWISTFGAVAVLVACALIPLHPSTRSFAFVVVTLAVQAATPACTLLPLASSGEADAIPVNDAAAISPFVTGPEKFAVMTVPAASPVGAVPEAIAPWKLRASCA